MTFLIVINVLGQEPQGQLQGQNTQNTSNVKAQIKMHRKKTKKKKGIRSDDGQNEWCYNC